MVVVAYLYVCKDDLRLKERSLAELILCYQNLYFGCIRDL